MKTSTVHLHPRDVVSCSGCACPGGVTVVTRDAYPPVIAGLLALLGAEPVRAWHSGCHAVRPPRRTTTHYLHVPFTGTWAQLADRESIA